MSDPGETRIGPRTFRWGERTFVMGILNVTPDSFSGDGLLAATDADAVAAAVELAGADFIVLEGIPGALRGRLAEALLQRGQGVERLGEHALLSLDPAVCVVTCELEGDAAAVVHRRHAQGVLAGIEQQRGEDQPR